MSTTTDTQQGVTLTPSDVRNLRAYLARADDYDGATDGQRHDALIEMSGYLGAALDKTSSRPA